MALFIKGFGGKCSGSRRTAQIDSTNGAIPRIERRILPMNRKREREALHAVRHVACGSPQPSGGASELSGGLCAGRSLRSARRFAETAGLRRRRLRPADVCDVEQHARPFLGAAACEGQATSGRKLRAFAGRSCGPPIPHGIEDVATGPPPGSVCGPPRYTRESNSARRWPRRKKKARAPSQRNPGRRPAAAKTAYFAAAASACLRASMRLYQAARSAFRS